MSSHVITVLIKVRSLYSGQIETYCCVSCHAFRLHMRGLGKTEKVLCYS